MDSIVETTPLAPTDRPGVFDVKASIDDHHVYASGTLVLSGPTKAKLFLSVGPGLNYPIELSFREDESGVPSAEIVPSDSGVELSLVNWSAGALAAKQPIMVGSFDDHQVLLAIAVHPIGSDKATISRVISYSLLRGNPETPTALSN